MIHRDDPRVTPELVAEFLTETGIEPDRYRDKREDIVEGDRVLVTKNNRGRTRLYCLVTKTTRTQVTAFVPYHAAGTDGESVRFSRASEYGGDMPKIGSGSSYDRPTAHPIREATVRSEISRRLDKADDEARVDARTAIETAVKSIGSSVRQMSDADTILGLAARVVEIEKDAARILAEQLAAEEAEREARLAEMRR